MWITSPACVQMSVKTMISLAVKSYKYCKCSAVRVSTAVPRPARLSPLCRIAAGVFGVQPRVRAPVIDSRLQKHKQTKRREN